MSSEIECLTLLKTQMVDFLDELIESFPTEPDFVIFRIFVKDRLPIQDIMEYIVKNLCPLQDMVKNRDEKFFINNNLLFEKFDDKKTLGEELLTPTKIYVKSCLSAIKTSKVKALAHITGGGLIENLPRVLSPNLTPKIDYNSWKKPEIFSYLQKLGKVEDGEMHRTFNCGVGMAVVVDKNSADLVKNVLEKSGEIVHFIGELA